MTRLALTDVDNHPQCAPKSMTINLAQILAGDGIKKGLSHVLPPSRRADSSYVDTKCIGILAITIHHAVDLSAQDDNGFSDPYCVLAFAKFGKPVSISSLMQR